ncbi:MAG: hypothetical protein C4541_01365 [Candidatus Auribacter fodinae]|jgi:tripartite motif-containing protein 71|uniref:6-bladed beta-propeller n=1 Tax=Candidatus Auribacter fodinae TaxID=2093366 RepID=A0A3A4R5W4_9BACT|nr:MAG: hypothetical protein C4541_01365 [Candidatus Auribacter fodinae]
MNTVTDVRVINPSKSLRIDVMKDSNPSSIIKYDKSIVIAGQFDHKIFWLNLDGTVVKTVGGHGKTSGLFDYPTSLTIDRTGLLWVADRWNHRIAAMDMDGSILKTIGSYGREPGQFSEPWGICSAGDSIIVTDRNNHRVQVFALDGTLLRIFGVPGPDQSYYESEEFRRGMVFDSWVRRSHRLKPPDVFFFKDDYKIGTMEYPLSAAYTEDGSVWVVDSGNDRLQKFSRDGQFQRSFSSSNSSLPLEFIAYVTAIDKRTIAVSSETSDSLYIMTIDGEIKARLQKDGASLNAACATGDGHVLVLDSWNSVLYTFDIR